MRQNLTIVIPLPSLAIGQEGQVVQLNAVRPVDQRLMALGLMPGMTVKLVRVAPLGDPIAIEFHNQCVSLRKAEAEAVQVEPFPIRKNLVS